MARSIKAANSEIVARSSAENRPTTEACVERLASALLSLMVPECRGLIRQLQLLAKTSMIGRPAPPPDDTPCPAVRMATASQTLSLALMTGAKQSHRTLCAARQPIGNQLCAVQWPLNMSVMRPPPVYFRPCPVRPRSFAGPASRKRPARPAPDPACPSRRCAAG